MEKICARLNWFLLRLVVQWKMSIGAVDARDPSWTSRHRLPLRREIVSRQD